MIVLFSFLWVFFILIFLLGWWWGFCCLFVFCIMQCFAPFRMAHWCRSRQTDKLCGCVQNTEKGAYDIHTSQCINWLIIYLSQTHIMCMCGCAQRACILIHVHHNAIINYCTQHVLVFTNSEVPGLLCLTTHWRLTSVELCVRANHSLIMIIIFIIKK